MDVDPDVDMLNVSSLQSKPAQSAKALTAKNTRALVFINDTFDDIQAALSSWSHGEVKIVLNRVPTLEYKHATSKTANIDYQQTFKIPKVKASGRQMKYSWPGNTPGEAWRFACILAILHEIQTAILNNNTVTKRDIYYRQPELFRHQATVDHYIDDIAFTCGVTRKDLRITASPKGLLCGLHFIEEKTVKAGNTSTQCIQIVPNDLETITSHYIEHLRWILVVEKEASFKTLVEKNFNTHCLTGDGLIVTAKGYPDLSTRLFLRHVLNLTQGLPSRITVPIFSLVDCDPDGLDIHRCYASPTRCLAHEEDAALPGLSWLGVDICEWLDKKATMDRCLVLTKRDRGRAKGMLTKIVEAGGDAGMLSGDKQTAQRAKMKRCLQTMLMLGVKMEIQAVDEETVAGGLCAWLESRMLEART